MEPYYEDSAVTIYHGDCRLILPQLPKVDLVLTDPPYELGFMGKEWDKQGVSFRAETWRIIKDSCKPGTMMLCFGGTRTWHRIAVAIEDAGWEIRDTLMWLYGQGFPKSLDISKAIDKVKGEYVKGEVLPSSRTTGASTTGIATTFREKIAANPQSPEAQLWDGYGTALKPAFEPIILAMKPLDGTFANNALKYGVAGLNIDGSRISIEDNTGVWGTSNKACTPTFNASEGQHEFRSSQHPQGRYPANLILDEEAAQMLDEQSGRLTSGTGAVKKQTANGHQGVVYGTENRPAGTPNIEYGDSGGASRFFYCAKASKSERGEGNDHPTVKPLALIRYLCNLLKPPAAGIMLDPFMGSGSTLLECQELGIKAIGIDIGEHNCEIAAKRMRQSVFAFTTEAECLNSDSTVQQGTLV